MRMFVKGCKWLGSWMNVFAGMILFLMMILIVADIVLRFFGRPITGAYELVTVAGAAVIGYAIPKTSLDRGHISIDLLMEKRSECVKKVVFVLTRMPGIGLFVVLTWFLFQKAYALYNANEVSLVLRMPHYPVAYALAFCCFIESLVLVADIFTVFDEGEAK